MIRRHGCRLPDQGQKALMLSVLRGNYPAVGARKDFFKASLPWMVLLLAKLAPAHS
ncbi:hypothetical protein Kim5_PC00390 (plasmid) [Rhizobium sp. Kim5]|nr:hypothetical protein Kim5_PC00390 [Rhizobium sp. Kim5]